MSKRSIIFIRTSTTEQTPQIQLADIHTLNCSDAEIYTEQMSAWKENAKRPVFESIKILIRKKEVSDIYVWDLDRLYRNYKRLTEFFQLCKVYDCKIHSYRQPFLNEIYNVPDPFGEIIQDMMIKIFAWLGQSESDKRSDRVKMAVRRRSDGTYSHLGAKWGRKSLPKQTVDRVIELGAEGNSIREICKIVKIYNEDKGHGRFISIGAVQKILAQNRR